MLEEMMPRWVPTENVNGFEICPGLYRDEGATAFVQRHENVVIPDDFDYAPLETVTLEAREKLAKIRPRTLAQAGRIPGVSPSDLAQLSIALMKAGKTAAAE